MLISPSSTVASVILAGGQSSRMGQDKALLPWQAGGFQSPRQSLK